MMSLNTYSKNLALSQIMEKKLAKKADFEQFLEDLELLGESRLYLSAVARILKVSRQNSLDIIEILVKLDIVHPRYLVKINNKLLSTEYEGLEEIPSQIFDDELYEDFPINIKEDVFMFFKVVRDERC